MANDKYPRLKLKVQQTGYGFSEPQGQQTKTKLQGGFSRFRRGLVAGATDISCQLKLKSTDEQQYFSAFIKGLTKERSDGTQNGGIRFGEVPFICELVTRGMLEDHVCWMQWDTIKWGSFQGFTAVVNFTLEVEPLVDDKLNDQILDLVDNGVDPNDMTKTLDRMEKFVKEDMRRLRNQ